LQTLISTLSDSEFIAGENWRSVDSWYAEGCGTGRWRRRTGKYRDFETFFPDMPEGGPRAVENSEHPVPTDGERKSDRGLHHARRAEDE